MLRQPDVFTPNEIKEHSTSCEANVNGRTGWIPCRCEGHNLRSFLYRFRVAWNVLIGRYDALDWSAEAEYKRCVLKNNHATVALDVEDYNSMSKAGAAALDAHWTRQSNIARHMVNGVLEYYSVDEDYLEVTPLDPEQYIGFGPFWADITDPKEIAIVNCLFDIPDEEGLALTEVRAFWYNNSLHFTSGGRSVSSEWPVASPLDSPTIVRPPFASDVNWKGSPWSSGFIDQPETWPSVAPIEIPPSPLLPASMFDMEHKANSVKDFMEQPFTVLLNKLLVSKDLEPIQESQVNLSEPFSGPLEKWRPDGSHRGFQFIRHSLWVKALAQMAPVLADLDPTYTVFIDVDYDNETVTVKGFTNSIQPIEMKPLPVNSSGTPSEALTSSFVKMTDVSLSIATPSLLDMATAAKPTPPPGRVGYEHEMPKIQTP